MGDLIKYTHRDCPVFWGNFQCSTKTGLHPHLPVQERTGKFTAVFGNLAGRTAAGFPGIAEVTAGSSQRDTWANKNWCIVYVVTRHINLKKLANPDYPINPKTFGQKLRKWRLDNNLTIKALSKIIKADEMSIINWEKRNRTPLYKYVRKIKEVTGISPDSGFRDQRKTKPKPDSLGEHMRKKRQELGLSQEEMAEKLGVSVDYIANLETGKRPGKHKIQTIRSFLGL